MVKYLGIWLVVLVVFNDDGLVDLDGNCWILDCMIDQGVDGICVLVNFLEQFLILDIECEMLIWLLLEYVVGCVLVIVMISYYLMLIVVDRVWLVKLLGVVMVMVMLFYYGVLLKGMVDQIFQ